MLNSFIVPIFFLTMAVNAPSQPPAAKENKPKMIAGTAEILKSVPKRFAKLVAVDAARRQITLLIEGESLAKVWSLTPDAEIKVSGWWGRLEQFQLGDRVWAWFQLDRKKQPVVILMLADEPSEQDIHSSGIILETKDANSVTVKPAKDKSRKLTIGQAQVYRGKAKGAGAKALEAFKPGEKVYAQSMDGQARLVLDGAAFEARRSEQKLALRKRWLEEGLPGTVIFQHISGEIEIMLDHESMRWGRSLKAGDKVAIQATPPIEAQVQQVRPWRERTQVRFVVSGFDQADLALGQRVHLRMPAPPPEVESALLPPDVDRPRSKEERVEWVLASIYCTCQVKGDVCTGQFYTLSSCNPNGCGMPNHMRQVVAEKIAKGMTDRQILEELVKESGPPLFTPHLLP